MEAEKQAKEFAKALEDSKALDVKTYDVRGVSGFTDFFVVATGAAAPHLKALVKALPEASGGPESGWIVCDFVDVVVHIFSAEARAYYQLEKLWVK